MDKMKMCTQDIADENFRKLAELFPNAVTETMDENGEVVRAIDKDILMQEISATVVDGPEERYQFTWPDKRKAIRLASSPIAATLRPCREESVDFDKTENLYIEGDNLDVLKLLRETYLGKVKMIYIDPPYNTGNDFVYDDDFSVGSDEWRVSSGDYDEQGNRMVQNLESNGRFHTDWLNMIYPRLRLAKDLLCADGVIFISLDANEVENLKKICDEIFGHDNYRNQLLVRRRIKSLNVQFADNGLNSFNIGYEYIFVYAKSKTALFAPIRMKKANSTEKGSWNVFWSNADRPTMRYEVLGFTPTTGQWRWQKELAEQAVENYKTYLEKYSEKMTIEEYWRATGEKLKFIRRIPDGTGKNGGVQYYVGPSDTSLRTSNWTDIEVSQIAKDYDLPFDNPKNVDLMGTVVSSVRGDDFIVLDFFSGSATSADAVMQLNAKDGGNRKFIMVQLPEETDENSEAYKAGYKNICEIGKERIRRAGKKVVSEKWEVISREEKARYGCKELSRADCLAEINGTGEGDLFAGQKTSEDGAVCAVRSDEAGGGLNSIQHSGGTGSQFNPGVSAISGDSTGEQSGTGNTTSAECASEPPCPHGYFGSAATAAGSGKNAPCAFKNTIHCPLTAKHSPDIGFRVLKLDSTNMTDVYYNPAETSQDDLKNLISNIKTDRTPEDLLFQVMLELGILLSSKIEETTVGGKKVFNVADNFLIACFDDNVTDETVTAIAKQKPVYAVLRDSSFATDSVAANFEQIFATCSPDTVRRVL